MSVPTAPKKPETVVQQMSRLAMNAIATLPYSRQVQRNKQGDVVLDKDGKPEHRPMSMQQPIAAAAQYDIGGARIGY